eukprot:scaffold1228_cov246-Pinguiococcus_pyrenoidosus.AAC.10
MQTQKQARRAGRQVRQRRAQTRRRLSREGRRLVESPFAASARRTRALVIEGLDIIISHVEEVSLGETGRGARSARETLHGR